MGGWQVGQGVPAPLQSPSHGADADLLGGFLVVAILDLPSSLAFTSTALHALLLNAVEGGLAATPRLISPVGAWLLALLTPTPNDTTCNIVFGCKVLDDAMILLGFANLLQLLLCQHRHGGVRSRT